MEKRKKIFSIAGAVAACILLTVIGFKVYSFIRGETLTIYGNIDIRTVNLSFRVSGKLMHLNVDEGDSVSPGQVLAELDSAPYKNALLEAEANVAGQKAQLALMEEGYRTEEIAQVRYDMRQRQAASDYANAYFQRQQKLWATRAISQDELDNARTAAKEAQAALQAAKEKLSQYESGMRTQEIEAAHAKYMQAEAALAQAMLNLDDTTLKAPSNGTILTRAAEPGTMLSAGSTVFSLSLTSPVWVRAYVDETNLNKAVPGTEVKIYTDGKPDEPYSGTIGFVSPTAEFTPKSVQTPELRTDLVYRLRIVVINPDDGLRQGMPVTIVFP